MFFCVNKSKLRIFNISFRGIEKVPDFIVFTSCLFFVKITHFVESFAVCYFHRLDANHKNKVVAENPDLRNPFISHLRVSTHRGLWFRHLFLQDIFADFNKTAKISWYGIFCTAL